MTERTSSDGPSDPIATVKTYLKSGRMVCTYGADEARAEHLLYTMVPAEGDIHPIVDAAVRKFLEERMDGIYRPGCNTGCILVDEEMPGIEAVQRQRAFAIRECMLRTMAQMQLALEGLEPTPEDIDARLKEMLWERDSIHGPTIDKIKTIHLAMGPHYRPATHRRYAPRTLVALTIMEDAEAMTKKNRSASEAIRFNALERSGEIENTYPFYDEHLTVANPPKLY